MEQRSQSTLTLSDGQVSDQMRVSLFTVSLIVVPGSVILHRIAALAVLTPTQSSPRLERVHITHSSHISCRSLTRLGPGVIAATKMNKDNYYIFSFSQIYHTILKT